VRGEVAVGDGFGRFEHHCHLLFVQMREARVLEQPVCFHCLVQKEADLFQIHAHRAIAPQESFVDMCLKNTPNYCRQNSRSCLSF
jgi:hypothetical protein